MKEIFEDDKCVSCGLCSLICPVTAIEMREDVYGMEKPYINEDKCINCGLCKKNCILNKYNELHYPQKCYAAYDKNRDRVLNSASGGIGYLLYEEFLHNDDSGVVYGVRLKEDMLPIFEMCNNIDEVELFRGSIYAKADIYCIFESVKRNLQEDKRVLVIALPCQLAGLIRFLDIKKVNKDKFFCVDLLCHGVIPQEYFLQEIRGLKEYKKQTHGKINSVRFRSNIKSENYYIKYIFEDGYFIKRKAECDFYFNGFISNVLLQDSCYTCKFSQACRIGDLTIGDFIGLDKEGMCEEQRKRNISVIMVNTERGMELLSECSGEMILMERSIKEGLKGPSFNGGASYPRKLREKFKKDYRKVGYYWAIRKNTWVKIMKNRFIYVIKKTIKGVLLCEKKVKKV